MAKKPVDEEFETEVRRFLRGVKYTYFKARKISGSNFRLNVFYRDDSIVPRTSIVESYFIKYEDGKIQDNTI